MDLHKKYFWLKKSFYDNVVWLPQFFNSEEKNEVFRAVRYNLDDVENEDDPPVPEGLTYPIVDTGLDIFFDNSYEISKPSQSEDFYGQDANFNGFQPSYTLGSDGLTVYDNVTGLTWTKSPDWNGSGVINSEDKCFFRIFFRILQH